MTLREAGSAIGGVGLPALPVGVLGLMGSAEFLKGSEWQDEALWVTGGITLFAFAALIVGNALIKIGKMRGEY